MNVYWFGSEDIDVLISGANATSTNSAVDTNFQRSAVGTNGIGAATYPLVSYVGNPQSFGNLSSFWYHATVLISGPNTSANCIGFGFTDNAGVGRLYLRGTGTNGQWKLSTRNAAGTFTDVPGAIAILPVVANQLFKLDMFVNYSTSGRFTLYFNGVAALDTGAGVNITTDSATSLSFFQISNFFTGSSFGHWHSEIIVADSDTRAMRVWLMNSATAGNAQTWSGTASSVNKALISDATFISAASAGLIEEFKTGAIALPAGAWQVPSVKMSSRALVGATAPQHVEYVTRVGSTDFVGGSWAPPVGSFGNDTQNYMQATNPGTSAAWTTADLTAATFNYGLESVT
jgi:hypothetical protein